MNVKTETKKKWRSVGVLIGFVAVLLVVQAILMNPARTVVPGEWYVVQGFEGYKSETTEGIVVYRNGEFFEEPPSRFRDKFKVRSLGLCSKYVLSRVDAHYYKPTYCRAGTLFGKAKLYIGNEGYLILSATESELFLVPLPIKNNESHDLEKARDELRKLDDAR